MVNLKELALTYISTKECSVEEVAIDQLRKMEGGEGGAESPCSCNIACTVYTYTYTLCICQCDHRQHCKQHFPVMQYHIHHLR